MHPALWFVIAVLFTATGALGTGSAWADDQQVCFCKSDDCIWKDVGIEPGIRACSRIIQSGEYTETSVAKIYSRRGWWKSQKKDYDSALQDYDEAVRLDPKNAEAYEERGNVWQYKDDDDRAIADFNASNRVDQAYAPPYLWRGEIYQQKGDIVGARAEYHAALALPGKDTETRYIQGLARDQLKEIADSGVPDPSASRQNAAAANELGSSNARAAAFGVVKRTAGTGNDIDVCSNGEGDVAIDACTRQIAAARGGEYGSGEFGKLAIADSLADRATHYAVQGSYDRAIEDFNEAIRISPSPISAWFNWRGQTYGMKGAYDLAIDDFSRTIRLEPKYAAALFNRGQTYRAKGAYDLAIRDFNDAIRLNPEYATAYRMRGGVYHAMGNDDAAIANFSKAIELAPDYAAAFNGRGSAYFAKRDYLHASEDLTRAARLAPGDPEITGPEIVIAARSCAGEIDAPQGRGGACAALIADRRLPVDIRAVGLVGRAGADLPAASKQADFDRILGDLAEAVRLAPNNAATAYRIRSSVYVRLGDTDRALDAITKAIELEPKSPAIYIGRSLIYTSKGDHDRALADIEAAIRLDLRPAIYYVLRGNARLAKSQNNQPQTNLAMADYDSAIKLDPVNKNGVAALAWRRKGDLQFATGNVDAAIATYGEAIKLAPDDVDNYLARAVLLRVKGQNADAVRDYDHALATNPGTLSAYAGRAIVRFMERDFAGAANDFERLTRPLPNAYAALWLYLARARGPAR